MEQILIQVSNKEKAKILLELLESLDFVDFIEAKVKEESEVEKIFRPEQANFFALAGLWAERDITLESLRQQAWPRQHQ
jgi:hypothetical protein